jgi:hypothetical protein
MFSFVDRACMHSRDSRLRLRAGAAVTQKHAPLNEHPSSTSTMVRLPAQGHLEQGGESACIGGIEGQGLWYMQVLKMNVFVLCLQK